MTTVPTSLFDMLTKWFIALQAQLIAASAVEWACLLVLPMIAVMGGNQFNRWIDRHAMKTILTRVTDFVAPIAPALLTLLLWLIALAVLRHQHIHPELLPFAVKLAVATLAIRFATLLSTDRFATLVITSLVIVVTLLHLFDAWDPLIGALKAVKFSVGSVKLSLYKVFKAIFALSLLLWITNFFSALTEARLRKMKGLRASNRALIMKLSQIALYIFVFLIALQILGISLAAFSVIGGALGVGIGFGLQKIASNFISGLILLFEKAVQVDDLIELADGTQGTIQKISGRYTLVEGQDGRELLIPNEEFIIQRVVSLTHSNNYGRVDIAVTVSYECDLELALRLLVEATKGAPRLLKDRAPSSFVTNFVDHGITLVLYFWVESIAEGRMEPRSHVMREIRRQFTAHNIDIPYPIRQVHVTEDAPLAKPSSATRKVKKGVIV